MQATRGTPLTEAPDSDAPSRRIGTLVATAAVVVALDVVSKIIVVATLSDRPPVRLVDGVLRLTETRNAGAAFSIGTGATFLFTAVAVAVVVVIARTARRLRSIGWALVLGLLLGGALGTLVDRLFRSPGVGRGHVVDWIELPHWPVFNLADSAIVVGGIAAVLLGMRGIGVDGSRAAARSGDTGASGAPSAGTAVRPDEGDDGAAR